MMRIGYIDEDGGWQNTFYNFLKDEFEVVIFDITEETELESLTNEVFEEDLDMLVIDFRLDETGLVNFNADTLVDKIRERNLYYPLIILTSYELDALDYVENANLVNGKDMLDGEKPKVDILKHKIRKLASDYQDKLSKATKELELLEKKRIEEGLNPKEEDRYVELNNFLDNTVDAKGHLSRTFYSEDTNKKLDTLIDKMEHLLNKIPEEE